MDFSFSTLKNKELLIPVLNNLLARVCNSCFPKSSNLLASNSSSTPLATDRKRFQPPSSFSHTNSFSAGSLWSNSPIITIPTGEQFSSMTSLMSYPSSSVLTHTSPLNLSLNHHFTDSQPEQTGPLFISTSSPPTAPQHARYSFIIHCFQR